MNSIDALTVPALMAAIDATLVRQQVLASNIAGAGTPGRKPLQVSFERARSDLGSGGSPALQAVVRQAPAASIDGAARVDAELAAMAGNALHHQALLRTLDRHLSVMALAVSDGRR